MDVMQAFEQAADDVARWQLDAAEAKLRQILAEAPHTAPRVHTELAVALSLQGRGREALAEIERAIALAPLDATIRQNQLILEKLREPEDPKRFLNLHRDWGRTFTPAGGCLAMGQRPKAPGKLKLAYLGVDAHTALKRFIPVLADHHDREQFDLVFCHGLADESALNAARQRWPGIHHVATRHLSARRYARALAQLGVDIAVDLSGHGHGGTLQALAYRPARLQLTWLDYVAGTGVPAIDARIADAITDPDAASSNEPVLRLPMAQWCATAPSVAPASRSIDPERPPVLGLINVTVKLSERLLRWASAILERAPNARLLLLGLTGQQARKHALSQIPPHLHERVDAFDRVDEARYHELVAGVDLSLDPPVFSGATSTLDALVAGIPVLTCPGRLPHTRSTASILHTLGLQAWVAAHDEALIEQASIMLQEVAVLRSQRENLRERVLNSSLHDGRAFVSALEALYQRAWQDRSAKPASESPQLLAAAANAAIQAGDPQRVIYALEALSLYGAPVKVLQTLAQAYNQMGVRWLNQQARFEAARYFEMALEIQPDQSEARHNLSFCR